MSVPNKKVLEDPEMIAAEKEAKLILARAAATTTPECKAVQRKNLLRWLDKK